MNKEIESLTRLVKESVFKMEPYDAPAEGRGKKGIGRLDFNERLQKPPKRVIREVVSFAKKGEYQIYPEYGDLNEIIANYAGVKSSEVLLTDGSDEAIDIIYRAYVKKGAKIILPLPTFSTLKSSAQIEEAKIIALDGKELKDQSALAIRYKGENLDFPFDEVMRSIKTGVKAVILCNPNNPTGTAIPKGQLEQIIKKAKKIKAIVMVDEAYYEFAREIMPDISAVDLISKYDNLFITRSLSKSMGIAALRPGYVVTQEENIKHLEKIRPPYSVNQVAAVAMNALRYPEVRRDIEEYVYEVMKISKPLIEKFYKEHGIKFYPSAANFHLVEDKNGELAKFLESKKMLVRPRSDPKGTIRITIGARSDTKKYLKALDDYLKTTQSIAS